MISDALNIQELSTCGTVLFLLEKQGAKPEQYLAIIKEEIKRRQQSEINRHATVTPDFGKCPKCDKRLMMRRIATAKGRANRFGYKSLLFCPHCVFEKYSRLTVGERIKGAGNGRD